MLPVRPLVQRADAARLLMRRRQALAFVQMRDRFLDEMIVDEMALLAIGAASFQFIHIFSVVHGRRLLGRNLFRRWVQIFDGRVLTALGWLGVGCGVGCCGFFPSEIQLTRLSSLAFRLLQ
jgi:hypothetical protein